MQSYEVCNSARFQDIFISYIPLKVCNVATSRQPSIDRRGEGFGVSIYQKRPNISGPGVASVAGPGAAGGRALPVVPIVTKNIPYVPVGISLWNHGVARGSVALLHTKGGTSAY
jgi:hypothetical protein